MMPQDNAYGKWAASGEIDIFESRNNFTEVVNNLHYGAWGADSEAASQPGGRWSVVAVFIPVHTDVRFPSEATVLVYIPRLNQ